MISKEKIKKNFQKFNETAIKYGVMNDDLLELLGVEFIGAPCSTKESTYNAYEGGLVQHILTTTKHAVLINNSLPEDKQVDQKTLIRVCLLHQIGKAPMFIEQDSSWHKDRGEMYKFDNDQLSFKVAERSVYYAMKSGIELTENEVYGIFNYNSDFASRPLNGEAERVAAIVRTAQLVAAIAEK
tara:strand:- start:66737 stop:67288 length:552 start_codon:yes stop_codon:yes gene_type:complete